MNNGASELSNARVYLKVRSIKNFRRHWEYEGIYARSHKVKFFVNSVWQYLLVGKNLSSCVMLGKCLSWIG